MSIVVVGSINTDLTIQVPHFAAQNETVLGSGEFANTQGGKGANQAVAAAAGGLPVAMVGKIGKDAFGDAAISALRAAGVNCDHVVRAKNRSTGIATIFLDPQGNNSITVAPGANAHMTTADVQAARPAIEAADILMLQLEIPVDAVSEAIAIAQQSGTLVMLDPAPASVALPDFQGIDYLTPNEIEAQTLTGLSPVAADGPRKIAKALRAKGVQQVILTLGEKGCYVESDEQAAHIKTKSVTAVDTTGAGDVFNGFLATALAKGMSVGDAAEVACAAASLSVTRPGARSRLPNWQDAIDFLAS